MYNTYISGRSDNKAWLWSMAIWIWMSFDQFFDGYPIRDWIACTARSPQISANLIFYPRRTCSRIEKRRSRCVYTIGETDGKRRNREPFWSHSRYRRLNRILRVRLSYPAVLSCPGQRCPLLSNIHRAHVISSFLYPFSLPVYWVSILPVSPSVRAYSCSSAIFFEKYTKRLPFARQKFPFSRKRLRDAFKRVKCK